MKGKAYAKKEGYKSVKEMRKHEAGESASYERMEKKMSPGCGSLTSKGIRSYK